MRGRLLKQDLCGILLTDRLDLQHVCSDGRGARGTRLGGSNERDHFGVRPGAKSENCSYFEPLAARLLPRVEVWWSWPGLNRRPRECHSRALPTALQPHIVSSGNARKYL